MNGLVIEKISCGSSHSLLLSNEGVIYAFGKYYNKKLDVSDAKPLKLNNSNKFANIATRFNENIFAALSDNCVYYVWGKNKPKEEIIREPKVTTFKSFNEIFTKYLQITYQPIEGMIIEFEDSFARNDFYMNSFEELEKLGAGSYGVVFKVNDRNIVNDNFQAVKKIRFKNENETEILKELKIYDLVSRIRHKNMVRYNSFWTEKNLIKKSFTLYIGMELCEQSLTDFIETLEGINFDETDSSKHLKHYISSNLFVDILEGVNHLHKHNPKIIHRDLCPDNILLKSEMGNKVIVKIADFGLVTIHKYAEQLHESDKGRLKYFAPEVENGRKYDTKADIYSLGRILNDLFDVEFDECDFDEESILSRKYDNIKKLFEKMISELVDERPSCDLILRDKNFWVLNVIELTNYLKTEELLNKIELKFNELPFVFKFLKSRILDEM